MSSLQWELSPSLRSKAHEDAMIAALAEIQARTTLAAGALGPLVAYSGDGDRLIRLMAITRSGDRDHLGMAR